MNIKEYTAEIAARLAVRRLFIFTFAACMIANVILAAAVVSVEDKSRIIVLPAEPKKSFWIDNHAVSSEYLEQMGSYIAQLALNNSPETFDYNINQILKYVAPDKRGEVELALIEQARRMKSANASSSFIPNRIEVLPQSMKVSVNGHVRHFIGNTLTSTSPKCIQARFSYEGSRLWLNGLTESDCRKPFDDSNSAVQGA